MYERYVHMGWMYVCEQLIDASLVVACAAGVCERENERERERKRKRKRESERQRVKQRQTKTRQ